ncbi:MAG: hypothetical protein K2Y35_11140 [Burkholderiales bacterium]|nr:hypothetical protein [Burkholderiales bacterium]
MTTLRDQAGRSRVRTIVAMAIIASLVAVLLERLLYYAEYAEKTVAELTITNMRTGLNLRKAEMMMASALGAPGGVLGDNPMVWLPAPTSNYTGEFAGQAPHEAGDGIWYFDRGARELAYRPNLARHFVPGPDGHTEVRVKVERRRPALIAAAGASPGPNPAPWEGVALVLARPYRWF